MHVELSQQHEQHGFSSMLWKIHPESIFSWRGQKLRQLHEACRAKQEVRRRKCTEHLISFQNKTWADSTRSTGHRKQTHNRLKTTTLNCVGSWFMQQSRTDDEIHTIWATTWGSASDSPGGVWSCVEDVVKSSCGRLLWRSIVNSSSLRPTPPSTRLQTGPWSVTHELCKPSRTLEQIHCSSDCSPSAHKQLFSWPC